MHSKRTNAIGGRKLNNNYQPQPKMKTPIKPATLILVFFITALVVACSGKKSEHAEGAGSEEWPEMDAFHMSMAEAFHPFKDSANLKPAKESAARLAEDADKWAASKLPDKVNNDEVKASLKKLSADSHTFADHVKSGTADAELGKELTELHSGFHSIMEAYHGGGKEGKEHH